MKFVNKSVFLLAAALVVSSCSRTEDPTFSTTPSERVEFALSEAQSVLTSASNGWKVRIYPAADQKWGGYTVFLKFGADGSLTAANELFAADATFSSHYKIDNTILPSVNFDTYNKAIHVFSEPNLTAMIAADKAENGDNATLTRFSGASTNRGLEGDYSYQLVSVSKDTVVMRGVRSQSLAVMTPAGSEEWATQLTAIKKASEDLAMPRVKLTVGGVTYSGRMTTATRQLRLLNDQDVVVLSSPFAYTANGVELYETVSLGGVSLKSFTANTAGSTTLTSTDGKATLEPRVQSISELIADTKELWSLYTGGSATAEMSGRFQTAFDKFNTLNDGKYMLLDVDLGASEYPGYTDFGLYAVAYDLETFGVVVAYLPLKVTVDSPTELTLLFEPSRILQEQSAGIEASLAKILVAGFSGVGQIQDRDGNYLYNEELKSRSFTVTTDNLVKASWIKLVDKSDSNNWIKLNRSVVANP